ncbi:Non-specific serine/threonine protein kinase [Bertholletia excelsa]
MLPLALSKSDGSLSQPCNGNFSCGTLVGVGYPFRGDREPENCGYPGLVLNCKGNIPTIDIANMTYRVLGINPNSQTLKLVRDDLMDARCPQELVNTTLDNSLFDSVQGYTNLWFLFGCLTKPVIELPSGISPVVSCNVAGYDGAYLIPEIPGLKATCASVVTVQADIIGLIPTAENLETAIRAGFEVRWKVDSEACSDCVGSKGQCGYDPGTKKTTCYCPDPSVAGGTSCSLVTAIGTPPTSSPAPPGSSSKATKPSKLAFFIPGAILAGIGMGWIIFACRHWRKRRPRNDDQSRPAESQRKDIPFLPLKKKSFTPTTSTSFSQSIPSVSSSNSDVGKASSYFGVQIFTYAELEEATNNFDRSRELGDGGFGTVYYGKLRDGRVVAVKRLYENNFKRLEQFMNEVEILARLQHKNLVTLFGCTSRRSRELLLVYEYIPNGTVADHLHGKRKNSGLLSWPIRLNIAIETAEALDYLHASDIIHRDVKTTNVLLDNDFHVKVVDFGLSRLFPNDVTHVSTAPQGTPGYVDPEYYQCYQLTEKSDVYSFGVVLIELISSKEAIDTNRERHDINLSNMAISKIQNGALHELVDPALGFEPNSSVRRMITLVAELGFRCLQMERDLRPSMKEVVGALRRIKDEELKAEPGEVVEVIVEDDAGPLKGNPPPPDS